MTRANKRTTPDDVSYPPPAKTSAGRQNQLIEAAFDLAERRLREGSASAQETVHFLRLGSEKERLEREKLKHEVEVLKSRVKEAESRTSSEELYSKALQAMRGYTGEVPIERDDEDPNIF